MSTHDIERQRQAFEAWAKKTNRRGNFSLREGEGYADGYANSDWHVWKAAHAAIEADRQRRSEPVGYFQNVNSLLPDASPLYEQVQDECKDQPDVFPLYASPQPVEPVEMPSDEEIFELAHDFSGMTFEDLDVVGFARALLERYGRGQK